MTDPSVHKDIAQRISPAPLQYWHLLKITKFWQLANTFYILRQLIECSLLPNLEKRTVRVTSSECMSCWQALQDSWVNVLSNCMDRNIPLTRGEFPWVSRMHENLTLLLPLNLVDWVPASHLASFHESLYLYLILLLWTHIGWLPVSYLITLNSYRLVTCISSYYSELL